MAGILTRTDLFAALGEFGKDCPVDTVMRHSFPTTDPAETMETTLERLDVHEEQTMRVVDRGRLVGLLPQQSG